MKLLTKELERKLPPLYATEGQGFDRICYVKFFHPFSPAYWWACEYDPKEQLFFGYVTGMTEDEWGYFSLQELQELKVRGLPMERDRFFDPQPLRQALEGHRIAVPV